MGDGVEGPWSSMGHLGDGVEHSWSSTGHLGDGVEHPGPVWGIWEVEQGGGLVQRGLFGDMN